MAGEKQLFAPVPLRAMSAGLSGLQYAVLINVAAHDRLSLATGKGQGCRASNERMREMIGCSYGKLCAALMDLCELGFLKREMLGRHTVYRVIYTDEDRCLFGHTTGKSTCDQKVRQTPVTCDQHTPENAGNQPESDSQYIPLNEGIDFVETREKNPSEEARFGARSSAIVRFAENAGAQMAALERRLRAGQPVDRVAWYKYLDDLREFEEHSGRAERLSEELCELMTAEEFDTCVRF